MNQRAKLEKLIIRESVTIKEALKQMGVGGEKILFVVNAQDQLCGTLTDGDIRRWILDEGSLSEMVSKIFNPKPKTLSTSYNLSKAKEIMVQEKIEVLPVIDSNNRLVEALFWSETLSGQITSRAKQLDIPVLIVAGGKGSRLDPLTKIFPKPLIPIGDKPIIELILERFKSFGCRDFYLSVNYKGKMIQSYFEHSEIKHKITFIWEDEPSGTAGSIPKAVDLIQHRDMFISNCDILIKADYSDIYDFHLQHDNDITVIGSMQHLAVPYGVLELRNGGKLEKIIEKPEYDFLVNTGFYVVKKKAVGHIPQNTSYDFPNFIMSVKNAGGRVGVYPVSQQAWIDIGQWQEYKNVLCHLEPGSGSSPL